MNKLIKYIILFVTLYIFAISCKDTDDFSVKEIEPNNDFDNAQFVDNSVFIEGDILNNDIDYYHIKSSDALYFSFDIKTSFYKVPLVFDIIENEKVISRVNTGDIKKYDGNINFPAYKIDSEKNYYFNISYASKADNKMYYHLMVNFYTNFITKKEIEPNNTFSLAQDLISPNTKLEGSFIKSVVNNDSIVDVDVYKIENVLNKDINMDIIIDYKDKSKVKMVLFDDNYNYIIEDNYNIKYAFPSNSVFYIMISLKESDNYTLPYDLEYKTY